MSSYFVNSTFPVTLAGGQESFLGQIPLYSSGYTDPLRHYPGAAYGATSVQEKAYSSSFYQQTNGAYSRSSSVGACDYAAASFYRDKDPACALASIEDHSLVLSQDHRKTDCTGPHNKGLFDESEDQKPSVPVYPWMQRMNSCNGESLLFCHVLAAVFGCCLHTHRLACYVTCCFTVQRRKPVQWENNVALVFSSITVRVEPDRHTALLHFTLLTRFALSLSFTTRRCV